MIAGAQLILSQQRPRPPLFSLPDQDGLPFTLETYLGRAPVLLVFYRGHWCPYCRRYLAKIRDHFPRFQAHGATLVAISPEPIATSLALSAEMMLPYRLLCDTDGRVIDAYEVRNRLASATTLLPHPAVVLIDPDGRICYRSVDRNYRKRTTMRAILGVLEAMHPH